MNKSNQETKLVVIAVMISAVAGLAAQSLTTTQTAEARLNGCTETHDGSFRCTGGERYDVDAQGGHGGQNTVNYETGEASESGGGSRTGGFHCEYNIYEEGSRCVGNRVP
jgi:hypothetical protein